MKTIWLFAPGGLEKCSDNNVNVLMMSEHPLNWRSHKTELDHFSGSASVKVKSSVSKNLGSSTMWWLNFAETNLSNTQTFAEQKKLKKYCVTVTSQLGLVTKVEFITCNHSTVVDSFLFWLFGCQQPPLSALYFKAKTIRCLFLLRQRQKFTEGNETGRYNC